MNRNCSISKPNIFRILCLPRPGSSICLFFIQNSAHAGENLNNLVDSKHFPREHNYCSRLNILLVENVSRLKIKLVIWKQKENVWWKKAAKLL
jgi:hypothetical protein